MVLIDFNYVVKVVFNTVKILFFYLVGRRVSCGETH